MTNQTETQKLEEETLKNFKPGDVVLFNWADNWFMKSIKFFNYLNYGKSKATHAGIVSRVTAQTIYIYEAMETGQKNNDWFEYAYEKWWLEAKIKEGLVSVKRYKGKIKKSVSKACEQYLGSSYDWASIVLMVLRLSFNSTKRLFCSEAVARVLYDITDKKCVIREDYEKITPMDLYLSDELVNVQ